MVPSELQFNIDASKAIPITPAGDLAVAPQPAGILRDQAKLIEPELLKHLGRVKALPASLTKKKAQPKPSEEKKPEPAKSLRQPEPKPVATPQPKKPEPAKPVARPTARPAATAAPGEKIVGKIGAQPGPVEPKTEAPPKKETIPESAFEVAEAKKPTRPGKSIEEKKKPNPVEAKKVEPHAVVENSPFEMDDDDDDDTNFKPARPNTTPVHLSVPAARKREADARKENQDDDEQAGPRYSFELG